MKYIHYVSIIALFMFPIAPPVLALDCASTSFWYRVGHQDYTREAVENNREWTGPVRDVPAQCREAYDKGAGDTQRYYQRIRQQ